MTKGRYTIYETTKERCTIYKTLGSYSESTRDTIPPLSKSVVFPCYRPILFLLSQMVNVQTMGDFGYKNTPSLLHS